MRLIGFTGFFRSGKTTAARYLTENMGYEYMRFAGPLKQMLKVLGLTDDQVDGNLKNEPCELLGGKTPRYAMESLGTSWGRDMIVPDLWARAWKNRLYEAQKTGKDRFVLDDCRFLNEAELIRSMGGVIVKIDRPGIEPDLSLPTERAQLQIVADYRLVNQGSIKDLEDRVDAFATGWNAIKAAA
jgi:hypothetical protein